MRDFSTPSMAEIEMLDARWLTVIFISLDLSNSLPRAVEEIMHYSCGILISFQLLLGHLIQFSTAFCQSLAFFIAFQVKLQAPSGKVQLEGISPLIKLG
jgi:hypothetical protein